ncbi:MAG TPA: hypothetical protein PLD88_05670, partial [Candidatus Berkiella sp.]|nr:hypothetical protein [Candidatus Berkiella sp.]
MKAISRLVIILFSSAVITGLAKPSPLPFAEEDSDWIDAPGDISLCKGHYLPYDTQYVATDGSWLLPVELSANETEFNFDG